MPHGNQDPFAGLPPALDSTSEVREELTQADLDPMDIETEDQAVFGHSLTHAFADDPDMGGRTEEQLEAEHAMTVMAMHDFGVGHDSSLDF